MTDSRFNAIALGGMLLIGFLLGIRVGVLAEASSKKEDAAQPTGAALAPETGSPEVAKETFTTEYFTRMGSYGGGGQLVVVRIPSGDRLAIYTTSKGATMVLLPGN